MIDATFTLTARDVAATRRTVFLIWFFRRKAVWTVWLCSAACGAALAIFISYMHTSSLVQLKLVLWRNMLLYAGLFVGLCALFFILAYAGSAKQARQVMQKFKWLQGQISVRLDAGRVCYGNDIASSNNSWHAFIGWAENADLLLLFVDEGRAMILPKRALSGPPDLDRIRIWLTDTGVPRLAPFR